jgi:hypothetical protein
MTTLQIAAWAWVALILIGAACLVVYSQRKLRRIREQALQRSFFDAAD